MNYMATFINRKRRSRSQESNEILTQTNGFASHAVEKCCRQPSRKPETVHEQPEDGQQEQVAEDLANARAYTKPKIPIELFKDLLLILRNAFCLK